jgi:TRAF3-interacting protein 1
VSIRISLIEDCCQRGTYKKVKFEDTKGVIRSRKSLKDRQYNGQKKDRQYNDQKKKDRQYNGQKKKDRQYNDQKKDRQYNGQKKKDRQYNGQKKKDRQCNGQKKKDRQYNGQKKKIQDKKLDGKIKIDQHESKVEVEVRKRRLSVIVYFTLRSFG